MKEYYALYHLICKFPVSRSQPHPTGVFWLPSIIILISYASLSIWLQRSARGGTAKTDPRDRSNSCYSNVTTLYACTETQYQKRPLPVITVNPCDEEMGTVVHAVPVNHADTTVVSTAKHRARARSSAIRVTCLLVGAYIVCWLPYSMLLIWEFVSPTTYERYINQFINQSFIQLITATNT